MEDKGEIPRWAPCLAAKSTQIPNWGRKRGKRRNPGFGSLWKTPPLDKYPKFQQNLGKRLGWSLPSPHPRGRFKWGKRNEKWNSGYSFSLGNVLSQRKSWAHVRSTLSDPPSSQPKVLDVQGRIPQQRKEQKNPNQQHLKINSGLEWAFLGGWFGFWVKKPIKFYVNNLRNYPIKGN